MHPSPPPRSSPTSARAAANSPASGRWSASSAWGWGGRRSPTAWGVDWRAGRIWRILWSARPGTSSRRTASSPPASSLDCSCDHARRRSSAVPPAPRPLRHRRHRAHDARRAGAADRHDRELAGLGLASPAAAPRLRGQGQRHARRDAGGDALRPQRARRRPGGHRAPLRRRPPRPIRRDRLQREPGRAPAARRDRRGHRVRQARRGAGRRPHGVLRGRDGWQRDGPEAAALLPWRLRGSLGRMIGTELLDDPRADPGAVRRELRDIARLNALFGGTRAVVDALEPFFRHSGLGARGLGAASWTMLDVGTGLGDIPRAVAADARRRGITLTPIGLDVIPTAARPSREDGVSVVLGDGGALPFAAKSVDIVIASQVLHHLPRAVARRWIAGFDRMARRAVVLADLRRSRLAAAGGSLAF